MRGRKLSTVLLVGTANGISRKCCGITIHASGSNRGEQSEKVSPVLS